MKVFRSCGLKAAMIAAAMLLLGSTVAYAQTQGQIPMFGQPLTGFCNSAGGNDCIDSVITQDASGNVGIGTTVPQNLLHVGPGTSFISASRVNAVVASNSVDAGIAIAQNSGVNLMLQASGAGGYMGTTSNHPLIWRTNDLDRMAIDQNGNVVITTGNVGIGTTTPEAKLHAVTNGLLPAVSGTNTEDAFGGTGVFGHSVNGPGVRGQTDNFSFGGVEARSYQSSPVNLGLTAFGRAGMTGRLVVDSSDPAESGLGYSVAVAANTANGKGISGGWDTFSSRRWKTNIQTIQGALEKVGRLRGVSFDWKEGGKHDIGMIAEEVGEVIPEVVSYEENGKDAMGLDYARLTAVLIEAAKEQQSQIRELKAEIKGLKSLEKRTVELEEKDAEIADLKADNVDLKARLEALEGMVRNVAYQTARSEAK